MRSMLIHFRCDDSSAQGRNPSSASSGRRAVHSFSGFAATKTQFCLKFGCLSSGLQYKNQSYFFEFGSELSVAPVRINAHSVNLSVRVQNVNTNFSRAKERRYF